MYDLIKAVLLGIVEGVTEFLPVSSTGHLVLCERAMRVSLEEPDSIWKTFTVFIQIGAILAVVVYFRRRILDLLLGHRAPADRPAPLEVSAVLDHAREDEGRHGAHGPGGAGTLTAPSHAVRPAVRAAASDPEVVLTAAQRWHVLSMIALATVPALAVGYLTHDWIEANLGSPRVVVAALFVGGIAMLLIEFLRPNVTTHGMEGITWKQALGIGFAQCLAAVFPGTSRSAATIMGGMVGGLSRGASAEFSFFLAIPVMFAACGYSLLKYFMDEPVVTGRDVMLFAVGALVSFLVAWAVIDWFMGYIRRHTFVPFAIYRIALGIVLYLYAA